MALIGPPSIEDAFYGEINIRVDDSTGLVEVTGDSVPTVSLTRKKESPVNEAVPIGSRVGADLTVLIDGKAAEIAPSPGKLRRHTYRVKLSHGDLHYLFAPSSRNAANLIRNHTKIANFQLDIDEDINVRWLVSGAETQPLDASIGYALSVAFGTGALSVINMVSDMIFPASDAAGPIV